MNAPPPPPIRPTLRTRLDISVSSVPKCEDPIVASCDANADCTRGTGDVKRKPREFAGPATLDGRVACPVFELAKRKACHYHHQRTA
jgi:hypothetical protein